MSDIPILQIGKNVVVPIQTELDDIGAKKMQEEILYRIEKTGASGLVIDVSAVSIIDSFLGRILVDTSKMAKLMGANAVIAGMKKEVVMTLILLGLRMEGLKSAMNLEEGLNLLKKLQEKDAGRGSHENRIL
ncbi:MAG: STAS domain-containing protein [Desulfamplus sp.]|nr:STAS domain-containing protein [Desulfamplus sp.]